MSRQPFSARPACRGQTRILRKRVRQICDSAVRGRHAHLSR